MTHQSFGCDSVNAAELPDDIDCMDFIDFEGECMNDIDRFFLQCMVLADMDQLSEHVNVDECVPEVSQSDEPHNETIMDEDFPDIDESDDKDCNLENEAEEDIVVQELTVVDEGNVY